LFHNVVDGFSQVISDLKNPLFAKQDGVCHAVNDLKNIPAGTISKLDMEFEEPGKPCVKCTFDVKENGTPPKYREYKSYTDASQIPLPQFLNYLNEITSLSQLKYIFNAKKLNSQQAKEGMKMFLKTNAANLYKSFDNGGIGLDKCKQLFGDEVTSPQKLISKLDTQEGFNELLIFVDAK